MASVLAARNGAVGRLIGAGFSGRWFFFWRLDIISWIPGKAVL